MDSVGVRELRQDASALLARIEATGASIEITRHGRPVARLVPIAAGAVQSRDQLIADGLLRPGRGNLLDVVPVTLPPGSPTTAELLADLRDDR